MLLFPARPRVLCQSSLPGLQALLPPCFFPGQPLQSQKEKVLAAKESLIFEYFTSISTSSAFQLPQSQ